MTLQRARVATVSYRPNRMTKVFEICRGKVVERMISHPVSQTLMEISLQVSAAPSSSHSHWRWQIMHFDIRSVNIWWGRRKVIKKLPIPSPIVTAMAPSGNNKRKKPTKIFLLLSTLFAFSVQVFCVSRAVTIWTRRLKSQNSLVHSVRKMRSKRDEKQSQNFLLLQFTVHIYEAVYARGLL